MLYTFLPAAPAPLLRGHLRLGGANPAGERIDVTSRYLERGGRPVLPVMGEYHFARDRRENWYRELCKMKAGGVNIAATYLFWIYHEEDEGVFDFTGDRDVRAFVLAAQKAGLDVVLRIGPWAHGECRNGGFPDWLLQKPFPLRDSNPGYMALARRWYRRIFEEVQGLFYKDGGPIIGIQLENELTDNAPHLLGLKHLAQEIGFDVPLYTVTGWNSRYGAEIPVDDVLPVFGAYVDAPWADTRDPLPPTPHYVFDPVRNDAAIGMDQIAPAPDNGWLLPYERYPFATCELGAGLQSTHHRRVVVSPQDAYALSLTKLGSGNKLIGYYMYHGGINKIGRHSTLNESCATGYPNDCPILEYFPHTAVSPYGETGDTYRLLNLLHLFVQDFGALLAPLPYVAAAQAAAPGDAAALRYAMRSDGASGFVFVNQYQRLRAMQRVENVVFDTGAAQFPPLTVRGGASFILPFGLDLDSAGGARLDWATAQLLCRDGDTFFFAAVDGVEPAFCVNGRVLRPGALPDVTAVDGVRLVTLPLEQALYLRKLDGRVVLGEGCDLYRAAGAYCAAQPGDYAYRLWEDGRFVRHAVRQPFHPAQLHAEPLPELPFDPPYREELELGGPRRIACLKLTVTTAEGFVEITEPCDVAQLYADGALVADHYYDGLPWRLPARLLYGRECYLFLSEMRDDFYREW